MLESLKAASLNFCIHQIRNPHAISEEISKERTFIAYVDVDFETGAKHRVYLACEKEFIQQVATLFLEEEVSDEVTLIDMTLECANLIIGSAKVIAEDEGVNPYTIGTPIFEKVDHFDLAFDEAFSVTLNETAFSIATKELS